MQIARLLCKIPTNFTDDSQVGATNKSIDLLKHKFSSSRISCGQTHVSELRLEAATKIVPEVRYIRMNNNNLNSNRSKFSKNKRKRSSAAHVQGEDKQYYEEFDNNSDNNSGRASRPTRTNLRHRSATTVAIVGLKSKGSIARRRCQRKTSKFAKQITRNKDEENDESGDEELMDETSENRSDSAMNLPDVPMANPIADGYHIPDLEYLDNYDDDNDVKEEIQDVNHTKFSRNKIYGGDNSSINENENVIFTQSDILIKKNDKCENSEHINAKNNADSLILLLNDDNGYITNRKTVENCKNGKSIRSDSENELHNLQKNSNPICSPESAPHVSMVKDNSSSSNFAKCSALINSDSSHEIIKKISVSGSDDIENEVQQNQKKEKPINHTPSIRNEKKQEHAESIYTNALVSPIFGSSEEFSNSEKFQSVSNSNSNANFKKSNFETKGCAINNLLNIDSKQSRNEENDKPPNLPSYSYSCVESENTFKKKVGNEDTTTNQMQKDIKFGENQVNRTMAMQIEDDLLRQLKEKNETPEADFTQNKQTTVPETQQGQTRSFNDNSTNLDLDEVNRVISTCVPTTTTTAAPTVANVVSDNYHSNTSHLYSQPLQMPNQQYQHQHEMFYEQQNLTHHMQQDRPSDISNKVDPLLQQHQQPQQERQPEEQQLTENQEIPELKNHHHHQQQHLTEHMPPQPHQIYGQEPLFPYQQHHLLPPQHQQQLQPQQHHSGDSVMQHQFPLQNQIQPQFHLQQHQQHQMDQNSHMMAYFHHQHHEQQHLLNEHSHVHHHQTQQHHDEVNLHQVYSQQQESLYRETPHQHHSPQLGVIHQQHQQQQDQLHQQILIPDRAHVSTKCTNAIPKSIDDLMIDEFHDDVVNMPGTYKLGVSPANVKTETQDDGYETSAGDVLTPNSHSSSTNSITPLHQIQNPVSLMPSRLAKSDEGPHQKNIIDGGQHYDKQQQSHQCQQQSHEVQLHPDQRNERLDEKDGMQEAQLTAPLICEIPNNDNPVHNNNSYPFLNSDDMSGSNKMDILSPVAISSPITHMQSPNFINSQTGSSAENNNDSISISKIYTESPSGSPILKPQKKRGRKKKILSEDSSAICMQSVVPLLTNADSTCTNKAELLSAAASAGINIIKVKERKKHDRFNGMSEEEVIKRTLPDHLCENLDIVIVGINPGLFAAYKGHHYAGPGNHFWKCLYLSGLTQEQMNADEDYKLMKSGIGFTNMVQRATKGSADLTRKEIKEGSRVLLEKLQRFRPKIAVFNGKLIFEVFSGKKDFNFGRQPEYVEGTNTYIWVMPSSSARCAQLPRAADKVPFYAALKKFRDYLNGLISHMDESECIFSEQKIKLCCLDQDNMKGLTEKQHFANNGDDDGISSNSALHTTGVCPNAQSIHSDIVIQSKTQFPQFPNRQDDYIYSSNNSYMGNVAENETISTGTSHATEHDCTDTDAVIPITFQQIPGKKKRGRPKKVKDKDIFDSYIVPKMPIPRQLNTNPQLGTDMNNILNLSIMTGNNGMIESTKKKRGRPKKVKPSPDMMGLPMNSVMPPQKHQLHPMSIQALTSTHQDVETQSLQQQQSVYGSPPPNVHQNLYGTPKNSPVSSPSLNCTFGLTTTPPSVASCTPPRHQQQQHQPQHSQQVTMNSPHHSLTDLQNKKLDDNSNCNNYYSHKIGHPELARNVDSHLNVSSSPRGSPNLCVPEIGNTATDMQNQHTRNIGYNSPSQNTDQQQHPTRDHLNQWLSSHITQQNIQEESHRNSHFEIQLHDQPMPTYGEQHMQHQHNTTDDLQHNPLQSQDNSSAHAQWNKERMIYEDMSNRYSFMSSPQNQTQLHQHNMNAHNPTRGLATDTRRSIQQGTHTHIEQQQHTIDVASKSLSGLESLVDQIPTVAESDEIVVESRLDGDGQRNDLYCRDNSKEIINADLNETSQTLTNKITGRRSGSDENNGLYNNSQISFGIQQLQHSKSPLNNITQQQKEFTNDVPNNVSMLPEYDSNIDGAARKIKSNVPTISRDEGSPIVSSNMYTHRSSSNASHSNFSVLNLAASSTTSQQSNSDNYMPSTISDLSTSNIPTCTPYHRHHPNLMAAAALAAVAANTPSNLSPTVIQQQHHHVRHSQMYMDPHSHGHHMSSHIPVNSTIYPTAGPSSGHQHTHHHNTHTQHSTYGGSVNEYSLGSPFGNGSAVAPNGMHMLHMPSPNYPYSYNLGPAPTPQNSYAANSIHSSHQTGTATACHPSPDIVSATAATVVSYHHPHHHAHTSAHHPHHISMFDRIKPPNNISGYSAF